MRRMSVIVAAAGALLAPVVAFAQDESPSIPQPIQEPESPGVAFVVKLIALTANY